MKRRRWVGVAGGLLALAAAGAVLLRPRPPEAFPLAELVPADALFYAGFRDFREIEALRTPWSDEVRRRLDPARPHLAGPIAFYLDRSHQWVALARLTRVSALIAGAEVLNGAAVAAETPEALARHKAREGSLADLPEFAALGSRIFLNLERLKPRGRLRDFSAVGFELRSTAPITLRGRALYKGGLFRTYLEQYVQAPRQGEPWGTGPLKASLTEHFPRVWDEVIHDLLNPIDCDKAEREAQVLSREVLDGKPLRDLLARLGPTWGFRIVPTLTSRPALVVWIDLPDETTRDQARKAVHRAIQDGIRVRRDRGLAPAFEVADEGEITRVKLSSAAGLRLGEAFSPAFMFTKNRFIFSTCVSTLSAPAVADGESHGVIVLEPPPFFDLLRSLAPMFADDAFRTEADLRATALMLRTFTPGTMTMLKRQFPEPADLAKYQEAQRSQFESKALEELSRTPAYQEELARVTGSIDAWAKRLDWLSVVSWSGRFTSEGLTFEVRAVSRQ
ncbi:MAG: hypothetical protein HY293_12890 [Planctomycetes bacterium]|nr:hypothetical protein [Planctomycetota bacterium]